MACHVVKMRIHSAKNSITSSQSEQWIVPQLSIRINYNETWSVLIQWLIGLWSNDNLTQFKQWKAWFLFVISVIKYRIDFVILGRRLRNCGTIHSAITSSICSLVYVITQESPETRLVPFSIRAISMHIIESRGITNRKYLSKTILACRERQAKNTFRKCPSLYDSI